MSLNQFVASTSLFLACMSSVAYGLQGLGNFAIARPFSLHDASSLAGSFDLWSTFPPCREGAGGDQPKLFLIYSQSFENEDAGVAKAAAEDVKLRFGQTNGFGHCFDQVVSLAVNITPEEDLYRKDEQTTNVLWVNGPNRQFERTARALKEEGIDLVYLMEMDSVPIREYWLDTVVEDVQNQVDFAILGSKYRGDNWDNFYSKLTSSLVSHINGNAIYNLTSPFLWMLVEQLESESHSVENSVAFDYRIAQILDQAQFGTRPAFPPAFLSAHPISNISQEIKDSVEDIRVAIRETEVIGNYASTSIVESYLNGQEVIIHGATMRGTWDQNELGDISLVVSDWHEGNARHLLSDLDQSSHPFAEVVVLIDESVHPLELANLTKLPLQVISRQDHADQLDLCAAPISTEWFIKTNSFHRLRTKLEIMTEIVNGTMKPVVPFFHPTFASCISHPSCNREINFARELDQTTDQVFQTNQFVFHTESRNEFCDFIQRQFTNASVPSATSYFAFLQHYLAHNESLYVTYDKGSEGSRDLFVRLPASIVPNNLEFTNSSNASDVCTHFIAQDNCLDSHCEWRGAFESCRFSWNNETTLSPSSIPSVQPSLSPTVIEAPSIAPSLPPPPQTHSPTIEPTSKGVRQAPVETNVPTSLDIANRESQNGGSGTDRPVWVEAVTGTLLAIGAVMFVLMFLKKRSSNSDAQGAETRSNPDSDSMDPHARPVMVGDMDDLDSIQGFSSLNSDMYQTYISEAGHIAQTDDEVELVHR